MITVAECSSVDEALVLRSLLGDSGIDAYVADELSVTFRGQTGSIRLQVGDADAEEARRILAAAES